MKMHSSNDPGEFFHDLDDRSRNEILNWKEKRSMSLQRRMQEEMEARLEETSTNMNETTPFIRCILRTSGLWDHVGFDGDPLEDEACLTVWRPTEDQLSILKTGSTLWLRKVDVQPKLFDGRKQFVAQRETVIEHAACITPKKINTDPSNVDFASLLEAHILGRSWADLQHSENERRLNLIGFIIGVEQTKNSLTILMTDESYLLVRIALDHGGRNVLSKLRYVVESASSALVRNSFAVVGFENIVLEKFDHLTSCAIFGWGHKSHALLDPNGPRATRLKSLLRQKERVQLLQETASFSVLGIPRRSSLDRAQVLVGYIADFRLMKCHQLLLTIDVGSELTRAVSVPLAVLLEMQHIMEFKSLSCSVAFIDNEDCALDQLQSLRWLYRCRHILFKFALEYRIQSGSLAEVVSIQPLDKAAVSELYAMMIHK